MSTNTLENLIVHKATDLGFAGIGIASAAESISGHILDQWLEAGYAGDMTPYLQRHAPLRKHPGNITPGVRSIIAAAASYPRNQAPGNGFCMLAQTRDYHGVLRERLRSLADFIHRHQALTCARICVDSAPLPEREWAMRAGLGWQGRQGQLIIPGVGACTVLGFLLIDIELTPTQPIENQCGNCQRCVDSCPTQAIQKDRCIDARRCLSYLTIEHRGDIPQALASRMGGTLFGCDICTAICPWNERSEQKIMPGLESKNAGACMHLEACATISEDMFKKTFQDTTVQRSGYERLRRNARIVIDNLHSKRTGSTRQN